MHDYNQEVVSFTATAFNMAAFNFQPKHFNTPRFLQPRQFFKVLLYGRRMCVLSRVMQWWLALFIILPVLESDERFADLVSACFHIALVFVSTLVEHTVDC